MISYLDFGKLRRHNAAAAKHIGSPLVGMPASAAEAMSYPDNARRGPSHETPEDVRRRCGDKTQG